MFRVQTGLARTPFIAALGDVGAILLGGAQCLFLSVKPSCRSLFQRQPMLTFTLCSAKSQACSSASVASDLLITRARRASSYEARFGLGPACPGTGARLSRLLPTSQNFVDIGHADPEDGRSGISARSRIHCRHHPFAQVLRVSSPHTVPPSNQRREGIKNSAPMEYASDSINSEGALAVPQPVPIVN